MKRGEVWWVNFEPVVGGGIRKQRPAEVRLRRKKHKAMADQLTTVSKTRIANRMGSISKADLLAVERAIRVQLGL